MSCEYEIYLFDEWVKCSQDQFYSFEGDRRYGPPGRYIYIIDGIKFSPWLATTSYCCELGGRTLH